jgi:hypothetical protein
MSPEQSHTAIGGWVGEMVVGCGVTVGVEVGNTVGETVTAAVGCFVFVGKGMGVSGTAVISSVGAGDVGVRVGSMVGRTESAGEDTHEPSKITSATNNKATIIFRRVVRE